MVTLVGLGWASWNVQFSLWMLISRLVKTENLLDVVQISRLRRMIAKFARCQKQNSLLRLVNLMDDETEAYREFAELVETRQKM